MTTKISYVPRTTDSMLALAGRALRRLDVCRELNIRNFDGVDMGRTVKFIAGSVLVVGAVAAVIIYANWDEAVQVVSMGVNYIRYMGAPAGTISTEVAADSKQPTPIRRNSSALANGANPGQDDWPSYNRTLTSERFSPLNQITTANAADLKVLCTYDTGQYTGFNTGLLEVDGRSDLHDRVRYFLHQSK